MPEENIEEIFILLSLFLYVLLQSSFPAFTLMKLSFL